MAQTQTNSQNFIKIHSKKFVLPYLTPRTKFTSKKSSEHITVNTSSENNVISNGEKRRIKLSKEFPTAFQIKDSKCREEGKKEDGRGREGKKMIRIRVTSSYAHHNSSEVISTKQLFSPEIKSRERKCGNPIAPIKSFLKESPSFLAKALTSSLPIELSSLITISSRMTWNSVLKKTLEIQSFKPYFLQQVKVQSAKMSDDIRFWCRLCRKEENKCLFKIEKVFWNNPEGYVSLVYAFEKGCFVKDLIQSHYLLPEKVSVSILRRALKLLRKSNISGMLVSKISLDDLYITENGKLKILFPFQHLMTERQTSAYSRASSNKACIYTEKNFFADFLNSILFSKMEVEGDIRCCRPHSVFENYENKYSMQSAFLRKYYGASSINFFCQILRGNLFHYPTLDFVNNYIELIELVKIENSFPESDGEGIDRVLLNLEIVRKEGLEMDCEEAEGLADVLGISKETLFSKLKNF